jgi:thiol-disulfide isomerase/thioredoxin
MAYRNLIILALITFSFNALSQTYNAKIRDPKLNNQEVMIGYCNRAGLSADEFGVYFESQYDVYKPAEKYIEKLKEKINNVDIMIVFGSWCSDSKIQVGRFYKVLDEAGFKERQLKVIGVNRDKNALSVNIMDKDIERVPTFIVYQNGKELGRIIETPKKTLEKDLSKIVARAQ